MKIAIQTTSTKCQYSAAMSTLIASAGPEPAPVVDREQRAEPDHAGRHVRAVEAGEREERRAEQVRADRQPFVHERGELVRLEAEERRRRGCTSPTATAWTSRGCARWSCASGCLRFSTAASASTIASDDMSSTNVDADVTGMFRIGLSAVAHAGRSARPRAETARRRFAPCRSGTWR